MESQKAFLCGTRPESLFHTCDWFEQEFSRSVVGRARKPVALKVISGTDQPCRRPEIPPVDFALASEVPAPPDWLPNAHAIKEWHRLAPILCQVGLLTEAGTSALAMLCSLHGKIVQLYAAGEAPTGHMVAQYRALTNDFGLTPVAQGKVKPVGQKEEGNRFARNGKRPT